MALFNFGKKKEKKNAPACCCGSTEPKIEENASFCCGSASQAEESISCCCGKSVDGIAVSRFLALVARAAMLCWKQPRKLSRIWD